jgi:hypothetical protein
MRVAPGVPAFADRGQAVVGLVELLPGGGRAGVAGLREGNGDRVGRALVTRVTEGAQLIGGLAQRGQDRGVGTHGGGVVLAAGPHVGGPERPASEAVITWTLPPWLACSADHHGSTPAVGPACGTGRSRSASRRCSRGRDRRLARPAAHRAVPAPASVSGLQCPGNNALYCLRRAMQGGAP